MVSSLLMPALGQQLLELALIDEVAANRILQILLPVELDSRLEW
jgi:hypothetical protein